MQGSLKLGSLNLGGAMKWCNNSETEEVIFFLKAKDKTITVPFGQSLWRPHPTWRRPVAISNEHYIHTPTQRLNNHPSTLCAKHKCAVTGPKRKYTHRKYAKKKVESTFPNCNDVYFHTNRKNIAWGDFPPTQNIAPGHIFPLFRDRFFLAEFFWAWHFRYLRMMLNKCLTIFAY